MIYAVGAFDGFHRGHAELLKKARYMSECENAQWAVATFDANPQFMLGNNDFHTLFSDKERDFFAECLNVPKLLKLSFTEKLASMMPTDFMQFMEKQHKLTGIVIGENFRFGAKRTGDTKFLKSYCAEKNIALEIVPSVKIGDNVLSSTLIREIVSKGKIAEANKLLCLPYFITGRVVHGVARGRTLGFPTANIEPETHKVCPALGSYTTLTLIGNDIFRSVTNIGKNPTFGGTKISCETYIIDFDDDIYDKEISLFFVNENRAEVKFENREQLKEQLAKDVEKASKIATNFMLANARLIHKITQTAFDR